MSCSCECPMFGWVFKPTSREILYYLTSMKNGEESEYIIKDVGENEVYNVEPWRLPQITHPQLRDEVRYIFVDKRGDHDSIGHWRVDRGDKPVVSRTGEVLGFKKRLKFGDEWVMDEYSDSSRDGVICKIYRNSSTTT